jgi:superfamily II DNA or RNA helicase
MDSMEQTLRHGQALTPFPELAFQGDLRPSQREVVALARHKLASGAARRLHIAAPPGSGKTVLGLYIWAQVVKRPAVVLSPNAAIQAQWAARIDLFQDCATPANLVSTDPAQPAFLTSLTYQALTLPGRDHAELDALTQSLWVERLIEQGEVNSPEEAAAWIGDLATHNPTYYQQRIAVYRREARSALSQPGQALDTLHTAARETLTRLREAGIGMVILDECHHLLGHWGRVLHEAVDLFDGPIIVGLTATPPDLDEKPTEEVERYQRLLGELDYEVPVPAVVKDGFITPYQDLAYFVRPTEAELAYVAKADAALHALVEELCQVAPPGGVETTTRQNLLDWVSAVLAKRQLSASEAKDWRTFERRDGVFAHAARRFLMDRDLSLPKGVPPLLELDWLGDVPALTMLIPVLDRYIRHYLRRSPDAALQALAQRATARLRLLGVQMTETGTRACASPVGRVLAYSQSKMHALAPILGQEHAALGDQLRAVVITDYEKSSATGTLEGHPLSEEAGGAIAAFRILLHTPTTQVLNPILVTGATVLVADDLLDRFRQAAHTWLTQRKTAVELTDERHDGFHRIQGSGRDWGPRLYVSLITDLFQEGVTRCLVGTRGLLGEGWDASKLNVLIDLTAVTTAMTVNQLRGRSLRLDPDDPAKLADNWDVVCIAPEFTKGLDDYQRFRAKHQHLFGVTDDGAIEKGVGHVHAAFTTLKPEGVEGSVSLLNAEMLKRVPNRAASRALWRIGQPYHPEPVHAVEMRQSEGGRGGFPPFAGRRDPWTHHSLSLAIGHAVLEALQDAELVEQPSPIHAGERAGGYVRLFLEQASEGDSALFTQALAEALGPLRRPRYVIPRIADVEHPTLLSRWLPGALGRYFARRVRQVVMVHAVPAALSRSKAEVTLFEHRWNQYVSPGQAVYAHRGVGREMLDAARQQGLVPTAVPHRKEVFV